MRPGPGIDLHLHSDRSDGLLPPEELAQRALRAGLSVVALTDHDTTEGIAAFQAAAPELTCLPALELTCRVRPGPLGTVHVLGYGVRPGASALEAAARKNRLAKRAQLEAILAGLVQDGVTLRWEDVAGERGEDAYVGRNQVASRLIERGYARDRRQAFRRYLRAERVPEVEAVPAEEGVAAIHAAGGLAVLAHPGRRDLKEHLPRLVALGLDGLEVYRPRAQGGLLELALRAATKRDLLVTGGSDWHGHYPDPPLGSWVPPAEALAPALARLAAGDASPTPG